MSSDTAPDRQCGSCTVCCEVTRIKTDELVVPTGVACPHCASGRGCTVYERRPQACRDHLCGWRLFPDFPDSWRPDRCGFMVVFYPDDGPEYEIISTGNASDLHRPELVDLVARWLGDGAEIVLTLFGRPNELRAQLRLNDEIGADVAAMKSSEVYATLDEAHRVLREEHQWERDPEVLMTKIDTAP